MKKTQLALGALFLFAVGQAQANWEVGAGYHKLSENITISDSISYGADLHILTISGSYDFEVAQDLFVVPEISLGRDVSDDMQAFTEFPVPFGDTIANVDSISTEIDLYAQFAVRLEHRFDTGVYFYIVPSLLNVDTKTVINFGPVDGETNTIDGVSTFEDDKWNFGIGLGFGYQITQQISADVSYQNFEDVETLTLAAKYRF